MATTRPASGTDHAAPLGAPTGFREGFAADRRSGTLADEFLRADDIGTTFFGGRVAAEAVPVPLTVIAPVSHTPAHFPQPVHFSHSTRM
jgi:hypothetical protein